MAKIAAQIRLTSTSTKANCNCLSGPHRDNSQTSISDMSRGTARQGTQGMTALERATYPAACLLQPQDQIFP
ncbi:hypothetical protein WJX77_012150 [Trebouxia sp. C0004]